MFRRKDAPTVAVDGPAAWSCLFLVAFRMPLVGSATASKYVKLSPPQMTLYLRVVDSYETVVEPIAIVCVSYVPYTWMKILPFTSYNLIMPLTKSPH